MELIEVGYTMKPHGLNGEIKVVVEENYEDDFLNIEVVVLEIKGIQTPFFVESIRGANQLIVKFENIDNRDEALKISSKKLFLKAEDISSVEDQNPKDTSNIENIIGYLLKDNNSENQGIIAEIIDVNDQDMAIIDQNNKEVFVPLIPHWIIEIDSSKKEILMDLPIGLFDL